MKSVLHDVESPTELTRREREVLALILAGKSRMEVASLLYLSKRTVDCHLWTIYNKLGVSNRIQAMQRALGLGIRGEKSGLKCGENA